MSQLSFLDTHYQIKEDKADAKIELKSRKNVQSL